MSELVINVEMREERGSNASRRMRRDGLVPAVVYGGGIDAAAIVVNRKTVIELLKKGDAGENSIFNLTVGDKKRHAMIKHMDVDPTTGIIQHIDFVRVDMTEKVTVNVPIEIVGVPVGVKNQGGILDFVTREVSVECLPGDIPDHLELDVSKLSIGDHLEVSALELPPGVEMMEDEDRVLVGVAAPRLEEEDEDEEERDLIEAESDEPEVIGKGKEEEDEDEG